MATIDLGKISLLRKVLGHQVQHIQRKMLSNIQITTKLRLMLRLHLQQDKHHQQMV